MSAQAARPPDEKHEAGWFVTVTRHPARGREIEAFGGARRFRGKTVLDIGTGQGRLAFDVALLARRVVAVDPSAEAIRQAKARAERDGVRNVEFRIGDARTLKVIRDRERFDTAIFSWSL